jgi:hypothetical protein
MQQQSLSVCRPQSKKMGLIAEERAVKKSISTFLLLAFQVPHEAQDSLRQYQGRIALEASGVYSTVSENARYRT